MPIVDLATKFVRQWEIPGTQIRRPSKFVFLCGGRIGSESDPPASARDAFLRSLPNRDKIGEAIVVRAETANQMLADSHFDNLLDLEEYLSAIVDGVVLFLESAGSICELGAFTKTDEIRRKLLVFVMNDHANAQSFITLGPLKYLSGPQSLRPQIAQYHWEFVGQTAVVPSYALSEMIKDSSSHAASRYGLREKLDPCIKGHFILSVLAVCFLLRGGMFNEIKECMEVILSRCQTNRASPSVTTEIYKALDTLHILGLVKPVGNGLKRKHFVPQINRINVDVKFAEGVLPRDPLRWLTDIANLVREHDPIRMSIFSEHNHGA